MKKYRFHIVLHFREGNNIFYHSFSSDNDILHDSEIRKQIKLFYDKPHNGYSVINISKTIDD